MARPFYFELADRWFRSRAVDADDSLQQTAELLYACTGVEACGERAAWDALVAPRSAQEHEELLRLPATPTQPSLASTSC